MNERRNERERDRESERDKEKDKRGREHKREDKKRGGRDQNVPLYRHRHTQGPVYMYIM